MPEGLARWNGKDWAWLDRRNGRTLAVDYFNGQWATLDFSGQLRFYQGNSVSATVAAPSGLYDMCTKGSNIFVVGINGEFLRVAAKALQSINHPIRSHLYSVYGTDTAIYACGANGVVLRYADSVCQQIDSGCKIDLNSIWCGSDGALLALGGTGDEGFLVEINDGKIHQLPSRQFFLNGFSATEVYGVDWDGASWLWDGAGLKRLPLSDQMLAYCLSRSGNGLAIGGDDSIAIKEENGFRIIPVTLDPSFLA
jgi:hypothetical protein